MNKAPLSLLVVLVTAMTAGPLLGYGVAAAGPAVIEQIGITPGQLGSLASVAFVTAALTSSWLGRLADRIGVRAQLVVVHLSSLAALVLAAAAQNYWMLLVASVLAGPPLAICNPTTNGILIRDVPPAQRSGWLGIKQSGVQVAQLFSGLFFPAMTLWLGWRGAALGAAGVVVLFWIQSLVTVRTVGVSEPVGRGQRGSGASEVLPGTVWFLAGFALLTGFGMQATNVYLPTFAVQSLGYPLMVGGLAAAVTGTVGVVFRVFWGRQMRAGRRATTVFLIISAGAVGSGLALLAADLWAVHVLLWLGAVLLGACTLGANVVVNATIMQVVAKGSVGTATGITSMGMYIGFASGPMAMGVLRDATGDFRAGWIMVAAVYAIGGLLALALRRREPGEL